MVLIIGKKLKNFLNYKIYLYNPQPININKTDINNSLNSDKDNVVSSFEKKKKKLSKTVAIIIAIIACILAFFIWSTAFLLLEDLVLGWKSSVDGGGMYNIIKLVVLVIFLRFVWKKVRALGE